MIEWMKEHVGWTILIGVLILVFLVDSCSDKDDGYSLNGYSHYRVAISVRMTENTGVGNEFEWQFRVNGEIVNAGDIIPAQTPLSCYAKVVENDSYRYPDIGMNTVTIKPSQTNKATLYVYVDEYGGISNQGSYARFTVIFTFSGYNK